jgi:hypothetical protein
VGVAGEAWRSATQDGCSDRHRQLPSRRLVRPQEDEAGAHIGFAGVADVALRRTQACRLVPELRLGAFDEAPVFLEDRGLLTLTPCCSLPSLFGACHEDPHSPGKGGYGQYPRTRWWWGGALAECPGVTATKLHRGTTLFLSERLVRMVDPLCRTELDAASAGDHGPDAARLVDHLGAAGPTTTDDLKVELGLTSSALRRLRTRLERIGVILARHLRLDTPGGGHRHTSELARWDQRIPRTDPVRDVDETLVDLVLAAVEAAVVVPEADVRRFFSWRLPPDLLDSAVADGRLVRVGSAALATRSVVDA